MTEIQNQDVFSKPINLANLFSVQPKAIVSRILVKHSGGSITLFAFDAGQGVSEHTAPFDALIHVLEGAADVTIDQEKHTVNAAESILLPANVPHAVRAPQALKMLLVMLRKD